MLPNFLGIGAARAGTTWLARHLAEHPAIYLPRKKELHFFDRHYQQGLSVYEAEFQGWSGQRAVGEITPQYLHNEVVAGRIQALLPDVKLVCCLRNPVDRAYSHFWKSKASFPDPTNASFEEKLETLPEIIQVGFYYDHLQRYLALFPRRQIYIMLFEEIEAMPLQALQGIYRFLEVDEAFRPPVLNHKVNASAAQGNVGRSRLLWRLSRALRRIGVHSVAGSLERANTNDIPAMRAETRQKLAEIYCEQVDKLQDLIGRDLSSWGLTR